jgi:cellulose synthase/poly-beta-1,6-N-acetylglucosamine synthase-like glycosyltransferase
MLPPDALRKVAAHFADPALGAVGGTYVLDRPGSVGEARYWQYQIAVKTGEAALGAPLGQHGAFYCLRRAAWKPLPADTINDDFILPLEIFGRGWRVAYDTSIAAVELEVADAALDARRRSRIAAGNAQQVARLAWLLHPRFAGTALAFASGKALRVAAPFLIALGLAGSIILAAGSPLFALLAALQLAGLAGGLAGFVLGGAAPRVLAVGRYVLAGHLASARGVLRYCGGGHRAPWRRAIAS